MALAPKNEVSYTVGRLGTEIISDLNYHCWKNTGCLIPILHNLTSLKWQSSMLHISKQGTGIL